jgi:PAS domain S-box-containing protein
MLSFTRRSVHLLVWTLIAAAGGAAGWFGGMHGRSDLMRELAGDARRNALAFDAGETRRLEATSADLANPAYLSIKTRLSHLREIDPAVRSVRILRYLPGPAKVILLADSEPPDSKRISNPGDEFAGASRSPGLQSILRDGRPAVEGPSADSSGTWIRGYALIGERPPVGSQTGPADILALDLAADHWRRDAMIGGLRAAGWVWLLLGVPVGGLLVFRRQLKQVDLIRKLAQAAEQSRSAFVITSPDRRIEQVNAGLCAITGWRREEVIGQPVRMLASADTTDDQFQEIFAVVQAGRTWRGEAVNRRRDGSTYPARCVVAPLYNRAGRLTHIISAIEDVTERKQVDAALSYAKERAEAGERAKEQFLAMMSHEIRTPLNALIGFADLILDTPLDAEQREYVRAICDSGEALLQLTDDVLDYSKIDAGRLSLEPQRCSPLECVESALEAVAARAAEKHLELLHSVAAGTPAAVLADAARLRQVLANLLGNAVKFTPAGEIEVTVQAEPCPPDHPGAHRPAGAAPAPSWLLIFAVRDTGVGIAAAERGKLFKAFSQIDSSSTRRYSGAGLGLAISRSLVQMMGGDISVESEVGKGTTFTFTIVADEVPALPGAGEPPGQLALKDRTLAVASPTPPLRRELARLAERWGARAVECTRAQLAAETWDVAVIDLVPAETETWRQLFGQRPELASRPLVALIPVDFSIAERHALSGYFQAFVRKPARHQVLGMLLSASLQPVAPAAAATAPGASPSSAGGLGLRVLLVEGSPVNQRLTQKMLENLGCDWDLAEDGRLALSRLERGHYDLVLLDLHLTGVDGFAVIEQIRRGRAGERNQGIWITALANDQPEAQRVLTVTGGANDCLARPCKLADLEASLRRSLAGPATSA